MTRINDSDAVRGVELGVFTPITSRAQLPAACDWSLPPGGELVRTDQLTTLVDAAPLVLRRRRIVAVDGSPGSGKSTAVAALGASASIDAVTVEVRPKSSGLGLMQSFFEAITGAPHRGGTQRQVESALKVLLAEKPRLVIFDEVQNVGLPALQALRFLLDLPTGKWGLVLAGKGLLAMLAKEQMLDSRVALRVTMPKLTGNTLIDTLGKLHPLCADASPRLLLAIDIACTHGNLREWTKLLEWVIDLAPGSPLDVNLAEQAIAYVLGKPVQLPLHRT
ncbi:MAG TPA: ATP-binding protein [Acidothermaceae bacterium]|jgi:DNA transposition AAA+ family ATPase|nr:ATP-binding protein [Acidothermaceae bacterium]